MVPESSLGMIESGHGNPDTGPLCLREYVSYGLAAQIRVQGTGKGSR